MRCLAPAASRRPARAGGSPRRGVAHRRPRRAAAHDAGEAAGLPVAPVGVQVGVPRGCSPAPSARHVVRRAAGRPRRPRRRSPASRSTTRSRTTGAHRGRVRRASRRHLVAAAADRGPDRSGDRVRAEVAHHRDGPARRCPRSCRGGRRGRRRRRRRPGRPAAPGCSRPPGRRGRGRRSVVTSASTAGAGAGPGRVDHGDVGAVALVHEEQPLAGHAHRRARRGPVGLDVGRVVTDVAAEVEAGRGRRADTAARVGEPPVDPARPLAPTGPCSRHRHTRTTLTAHASGTRAGRSSRIG